MSLPILDRKCTECDGVGAISCEECNSIGRVHFAADAYDFSSIVLCAICEGDGATLCGVCDGEQRIPTEEGELLLEFVKKHLQIGEV